MHDDHVACSCGLKADLPWVMPQYGRKPPSNASSVNSAQTNLWPPWPHNYTTGTSTNVQWSTSSSTYPLFNSPLIVFMEDADYWPLYCMIHYQRDAAILHVDGEDTDG